MEVSILRVFVSVLLIVVCITGVGVAVCAESTSDNSAESIYNHGAALFFGYGGEVDRSAGCLMFEKAAQLDYPRAVFNLGNCYRSGDLGPRDMSRAEAQYVKAASLGDNEGHGGRQ